MRVFAHIARRYNSAAEAASLLRSVTSLAITACFDTRELKNHDDGLEVSYTVLRKRHQ